jgi:SOS-response transcriptional repressor LexA
MIELTPRQSEVYEAIKVHIEKVGFPPTLIELAELIGCSSQNAAAEHVKALKKKVTSPLLLALPGALPSSKQN